MSLLSIRPDKGFESICHEASFWIRWSQTSEGQRLMDIKQHEAARHLRSIMFTNRVTPNYNDDDFLKDIEEFDCLEDDVEPRGRSSVRARRSRDGMQIDSDDDSRDGQPDYRDAAFLDGEESAIDDQSSETDSQASFEIECVEEPFTEDDSNAASADERQEVDESLSDGDDEDDTPMPGIFATEGTGREDGLDDDDLMVIEEGADWLGSGRSSKRQRRV